MSSTNPQPPPEDQMSTPEAEPEMAAYDKARQQATAATDDQPGTEAIDEVVEPPPREMPTRDMNQT
jgi:hypothetical protein